MLRFFRTFGSVLFVLLALSLICCCAFIPTFALDTIPAHAVAAVPATTTLQDFLTGSVFPVLSAFFMGCFTLLMRWLGQKWKIQSLADENNFLFKLAAQGVALAEETAARRAGSISALNGSDKLSIAVNHILTSFPKVDHDRARDIVHSVLAQIPGAGATGEAVTLLPQEGGYSIGQPIDMTGLQPVEVPAAP